MCNMRSKKTKAIIPFIGAFIIGVLVSGLFGAFSSFWYPESNVESVVVEKNVVSYSNGEARRGCRKEHRKRKKRKHRSHSEHGVNRVEMEEVKAPPPPPPPPPANWR